MDEDAALNAIFEGLLEADNEVIGRSRPRYYNRKGEPIPMLEAARLSEAREYKIIEQTSLDNGLWVSTVWLPLDHRHGAGRPLIFETMVFDHRIGFKTKLELPGRDPVVFDSGLSPEYDCARYATEEEAVAGHRQMVEEWRQAKSPVPPWRPRVFGKRIPRKLKKRLKKNPEVWRQYFP